MSRANALVTLFAETSIHAGSGSSVDVIDLPIQREKHNGFPCVFGSAMKGALRAKAEQKLGESHESIRYVFGPAADSEQVSEHAGALMVSDARLLLLPIRSLTGYFKWVTSPALLKRFNRDIQRADLTPLVDLGCLANLPSNEQALVSSAGQHAGDLYLEEYRFTPQPVDMTGLIATLVQYTHLDEPSLQQQLTVVSDDMFSFMAQSATPVNAHIAINSSTKVVRTGALWYEETLPPETLLYMVLSAHAARAKEAIMDAGDILGAVTHQLLDVDDPYLQIGGNETTGMGWCHARVTIAGEEK